MRPGSPHEAGQRTLPEMTGGEMGHAAGSDAVSGHMTPWHCVPRYVLASPAS
jgi:hypothetical protein